MIKNLLRRIVAPAAFSGALARLASPGTFPLFLLTLCLAAYAPLMTRLGFYWDDFPMNWIATTMGGDGLTRYFSTNRPVWGIIYRITTPLLGSRPINWQVFALLLRWGTGLCLWMLLRLLWPEREGRDSRSTTGGDGRPSFSAAGRGGRESFAAWAAAFFVIYPGFSQQYISFLYSHFFIILIAFLLSLALMVRAARMAQRLEGRSARRWFWPLTAAALLLSLLNLLAMEYFFLLDLLRPLLIWIVLSETIPNPRQRLKHTFLAWLPYLAVFAGAMYWRSVLFGFQTYQPALMSRLRVAPLAALGQLIPVVLQDVWKTSAGALAKAFTLPAVLEIGARNLQRYWIFVAAGALVSIIYLLLYTANRDSELPGSGERPAAVNAWAAGWAWQPVGLGLIGLFIAGGPFWLTDLQIGLVFPNDRFTLPFMLGASLVLAGLLVPIPLPRWVKASLLGVALGFAIGLQYQNAITYSRDWSVQRSMFWQMVWRMPDLQPGTVLLSNELPVTHYTDNSLTAPLNWIYDPQNEPQVMQYALFYPTLRKETTLSNFQKDRPVELDYLAATFRGSTSKMVAFYYNPPGCLRVLDSQIDVYNWMVPLYLRESLSLASTAPILSSPQPGKPTPQPPANIFDAEIAHGWCYFFEKADLARQLGEWQKVAELGDEAFASSDYPNDPLERFPFIEGYAHTGSWDRAASLTLDTYSFSPKVMQPMLCKLWGRIAQQTTATPEQKKTLQTIRATLECSPVQK